MSENANQAFLDRFSDGRFNDDGNQTEQHPSHPGESRHRLHHHVIGLRGCRLLPAGTAKTGFRVR
jgi:hypothetical protein